MKKKLFLLPMFLLVFSLAACQQGGGEQSGGEGGQSGEGGGGSSGEGGGSSGGQTEKLSVKLNQTAASIEVGHSVSLMDMNDSTGVTYTHTETGDGEVEVKDANTPGAWLLTGKKAGTVNFKVKAAKGSETAEATCVVTVTEAQSQGGEGGGEGGGQQGGEGQTGELVKDEGFDTAPCAVIIGNHGYVVPVAEYEARGDATPTRAAAYHLANLSVTAGQLLEFYKEGQKLTAIGPSGDDAAHNNFNNFVGSVEAGLTVQANAAAADLHIGYYDDGGASFFLSGGTSADHGTQGGGQGGGESTPASVIEDGDTTYTISGLPTWVTDDGCVIFAWGWGGTAGNGAWIKCTYTDETTLTFKIDGEITGCLLARCAAETTLPNWQEKGNVPGRVYNQTGDITCTAGVLSYTSPAWKEYNPQ